jgi:hypothetical protein
MASVGTTPMAEPASMKTAISAIGTPTKRRKRSKGIKIRDFLSFRAPRHAAGFCAKSGRKSRTLRACGSGAHFSADNLALGRYLA